MTSTHYFRKKASTYDLRRSRGVLGWLRHQECKAILVFSNFRRGETVLDAGCGEGYYAQLAKFKGAKPYGVDLSTEMIARLHEKGIPGKVSALETLALGRQFDIIICAGVLEFTQYPEKALQALAHHLKPKGRLIILYSRPSLGTYAYVFIHRYHGLKLKVIPYARLQTFLKEAGLHITAHKKLPFFGGVALVEHRIP